MIQKALDTNAVQGELWTVGHSTLELPDFAGLLHAYRIEAVVDVLALRPS